jgi:hypothetical protein
MAEAKSVSEPEESGPNEYLAPRIEKVLHAEDLDREVQYAALPSGGRV